MATGVEGEQRLDVELAAERVPQLLTTAVLDPCEQFGRGEAERDRCEKIERRGLLFPIVLARVIHVGDASRDRVEGLERANERAGREHLDGDAAIACDGNPLRQTIGAGLKSW